MLAWLVTALLLGLASAQTKIIFSAPTFTSTVVNNNYNVQLDVVFTATNARDFSAIGDNAVCVRAIFRYTDGTSEPAKLTDLSVFDGRASANLGGLLPSSLLVRRSGSVELFVHSNTLGAENGAALTVVQTHDVADKVTVSFSATSVQVTGKVILTLQVIASRPPFSLF